MVNRELKISRALTVAKSFYKTYAIRPLREAWIWKQHKTRQNEHLSAIIREFKKTDLQDKASLEKAAEKILNDRKLKRWVCFPTLALALAHEHPESRGVVRVWYEKLAWRKIWEDERFTNSSGNIQEENVMNELEIKFGKNGESTDVRYNAFCALFPQGEGRILEAGSGVSKVAINWPAEAPNRKAIGIDYESYVIRIAREAVKVFERSGGRYGEDSKAEFSEGNILNMKEFINDDFDACFNSGVLEHYNPDQQKSILKEMARVVKIGGKVIISVPNYYSPSTMIRRWLNGVKRRNPDGSDVHLWWPFPNEQPLKTRELKKLFESMKEEGVKFSNIGSSGFNPFHNFMTKNFWRYKRVYGRTSRYISTKEISEHNLPRLTKGAYIWYQPMYTPVFNFIGKMLDSILTKPIDRLFNNWFSIKFGNQIIVWGTKTSPNIVDKKV